MESPRLLCRSIPSIVPRVQLAGPSRPSGSFHGREYLDVTILGWPGPAWEFRIGLNFAAQPEPYPVSPLKRREQ
jgi:hypothetical protein